jgi:hypothetical protein
VGGGGLDIASVIDKVTPYAHDFGPDAPILSARIDIAFHDGTVLFHLQHGFRGHPDTPGRSEAVEEKFRSLVDGLIPPTAAQRLIILTSDLEHQPDVNELIRLTLDLTKKDTSDASFEEP